MNEEVAVKAEDVGRRLDHFLVNRATGLSRNRVQKLIEAGLVRVNKILCCDKNYRLQLHDRVSVSIPPSEPSAVDAEPIPLAVVYEDNDLLVINKPRGMVVHPAPGHGSGTLVNALLDHCSDLSGIGGVTRPGIVHRLDKDTSGLLLVAKNDLAHQSLAEQLKTRQLHREYMALVYGRVTPPSGRIEAPIGRHPRHRKKMAVVFGGREAITHYRVISHIGRYSLLRLNLETGRTHQIRVHLSSIGYPVVGDPTYTQVNWGDLPPELTLPQALHACRIVFVHPRTSETMEFSVPLPEEFRRGLQALSIISGETGPIF